MAAASTSTVDPARLQLPDPHIWGNGIDEGLWNDVLDWELVNSYASSNTTQHDGLTATVADDVRRYNNSHDENLESGVDLPALTDLCHNHVCADHGQIETRLSDRGTAESRPDKLHFDASSSGTSSDSDESQSAISQPYFDRLWTSSVSQESLAALELQQQMLIDTLPCDTQLDKGFMEKYGVKRPNLERLVPNVNNEAASDSEGSLPPAFYKYFDKLRGISVYRERLADLELERLEGELLLDQQEDLSTQDGDFLETLGRDRLHLERLLQEAKNEAALLEAACGSQGLDVEEYRWCRTPTNAGKPTTEERIGSLSEDYLLRGLVWTHFYFPPDWFNGQDNVDSRAIETPSTHRARAERVQWLGLYLAFRMEYIKFDVHRKKFLTDPRKARTGEGLENRSRGNCVTSKRSLSEYLSDGALKSDNNALPGRPRLVSSKRVNSGYTVGSEWHDAYASPKKRSRFPKMVGGYECADPLCDKVFDTNGDRKKHERIHLPESEYPYACQYCQKRFINKKDSARHERTHPRKCNASA